MKPLQNGESVIILLAQPSGKGHWTILFKFKTTYFYFNAIGNYVPKIIHDYLRKHSYIEKPSHEEHIPTSKLITNTENIQGFNKQPAGNACGAYCLFMLDKMMEGSSLHKHYIIPTPKQAEARWVSALNKFDTEPTMKNREILLKHFSGSLRSPPLDTSAARFAHRH